MKTARHFVHLLAGLLLVRPFQGVCLWILVGVFALSDEAVAQAIDTNRPGFSYSPNVVERGQWQLETGISHTQINDDDWTSSLLLAEIRTGVSDQIEVFLSTLTWSNTRSDGSNSSGLEDIALGSKIKISDTDAKTQMALLFQLSVPIGDSDYSSDRWDPSLAFIWAHSGDLSIAGTVKVSQFHSGYHVVNGLKLPFSWSDTQSGFIEWEVNLPEGGHSTQWLNGGFQWLIKNNMQLDFNAGLGLNDRTADYRLGIGFSIRP